MTTMEDADNIRHSPDGSESEDEGTVAPTNISQIRRNQNAQFEALLAHRARYELPTQSKAEPASLRDEDLSIAGLVSRHDQGSSNLDPRAYQIELFERAKTRNIIAVLDTGAGKTLIAVLLLKHVLQKELVDRADGKAHRVAFFLVDSVTLVFQQAAVLRNNLDQNIALFYGAMGPDLWDEQTWNEHLKRNMVIVCTAQILNHALLNAFIKMRQINILIFDEAHHTKKEHPYARIIRDSYSKTEPEGRPKVFGMTASPVDAKVDIAQAASQLEDLLDSRIATTLKLPLLRQVVQRPSEETWPYKKLGPPFETELYQKIIAGYGDIKSLQPVFQFTKQASSELGIWCTDRIWEKALSDDVLPKLEGSVNRGTKLESQSPEMVEKEISRIHEISQIVRAHPKDHPLGAGQLSSKVELLLTLFQHHFGNSDNKKCIVFIEKRNTAKVLFELCQQLEIPNMRPGVLVGVRNVDLTARFTFRQQFLALVRFRKGEINCLFATSVAEEGLDIPDCNLVIRFNLYDTVIQYVQSRGRARHKDSTYVSMVEMGNEEHLRRIEEVRQGEKMMLEFCKALPKDRILDDGNDEYLQTVRQAGRSQRTYTIPSTGAKLTYPHAMAVLSRYAESLQSERDNFTQVTYFVISRDQSYYCEIVLPEKSPIRGLVGPIAPTKMMAKQSAAFDACMLLRKHHLLDDHFKSIYQKRLPAMRNAKLAIVSKKTNKYTMINKPSIWTLHQGVVPESLFALIISFHPSEPLSREHRSFMLLTRVKIPEFPAFPLYLENDTEAIIRTTALESVLSVSSDDLHHLSELMVSVFYDIFHKTFDLESTKFPYWVAPLKPSHAPAEKILLPAEVIDWEAINFVHENRELKWTEKMDTEFLMKHFLFDPWDGRKRYFPIAIDSTSCASDSVPPHLPRRRWMENLLNYSLSLGKSSRQKWLEYAKWDQPVIEAQCICLRRNFLDKATGPEKGEAGRLLICPQPLKISPLPLGLVTSLLAFPAIMCRMESYLIVMDGCRNLGLDISPQLALEAFTKDSDNTEEHRALQIHVQRGMGKNYERLEFLGDSVLKMATSIALFCQNPDDDEYDFHVNRMCLVCNRNMFNAAVKLRLYEYIRTRGFSRVGTHGIHLGVTLLHGRNYLRHPDFEGTHALGEKTIADVCEALIGAALLTGGKANRFDLAVKAVTLFVDSDSHKATCWEDYRASYAKPAYQMKTADGSDVDLAQKIFERLGYRFKYPRLLRSAFTHPSYPISWSKVPCYQRLEFLGDALLDMVCIEDLFHRYPDKDPQWLTEHKMAMVSNKFLGALTVKLGFHRHLLHFSNPIQANVTQYAEEIQMAADESEGSPDYWLNTRDAPKCLPDMLEAYLAAIFVDSDFEFNVIEDFFTAHVKPFFLDMSLYDTFANKHPTTFLYNQLTGIYGCSDYCLKSGEIPGVDGEEPQILAAVLVHGIPISEVIGISSRYAKVKASEKALEAISGILPEEFRIKFSCHCKASDADGVQQADVGTAI
ncbi:dicer-like protein 1 [Penicillium chermesinum]|uniref:Dicer-like protein 1 n=1 Tax=Penicillium chermesinum TaxID=63820 RepID=A0A9W9PHX0_9EURO|nr:dicer-like protein 1 [Penicillium chermesinum]KAJ5246236.1 dicer-like protein 1 [Penicillium chermesinum]